MPANKTKRAGLKWGWKRRTITLTINYASTDFEAEMMEERIKIYAQVEQAASNGKMGMGLVVESTEVEHEHDKKAPTAN